ncbi:ATP-dependent DNA helicase RecQ [Chitinophaga skermanii]|uniref:ATP-dependent DNA helicase RecQ n=1 Tax=Chitinophaga skermanii TaxID=331697 RepID=A0A327QIV4_9BACT|nr:ATP-dependent DNA helicase RecQ [Chitinophaga skermanii]RAJ04191.1 ATP-dependent DNA helicase RecQ [Chitinophaga skermanii]
MITPTTILRQYWGHQQFRPLQEDIIQAILAGKDTLALLPTGGGKSICFQVPAMMQKGMCLVISPLIALMKDQVENLRKRNISALHIYAGMPFKEVEKVLDLARRGEVKFLYISPERLQSKRFQEYCEQLPVKLIAVDEAHCISQWGYDFRPAYLQIATIRSFFPNVPVLALTATATRKVRKDICEKLLMKDPQIFTKSFVRSNLSYSVLEEEAKLTKIKHILDRVKGTAVVYCRNRRQTKDIATLLHAQGIAADYYHAGLTSAERNHKQEQWINNRTRVMVCTNAFGMGIDKADVRLVIHADVPDSIEAYYQEAGRAGRDELKAYAVLLYSSSDLTEMKARIPLQFPVASEIREVYQGIVNYLQVPVGSAEGVYYDFDINDFVKKFELNITVAYSAIRILEQEGFLQLSESVLMPSRVEFVINKDTLYEYEDANPAIEPLLKALLRTYEGIFDQPTRVFEKQLARILRTTDKVIIEQLKQLHQHGIIRFQPRKDEPQLCFVQQRIPVEQLTVNMVQIQERMKAYEERVDAMIAYTTNTTECRTQALVSYFGEDSAAPCGVCDVCIAQKNQQLSSATFEEVSTLVLTHVTTTPVGYDDLRNKLKAVDEKLLLSVVSFLVDEGNLERSHDGTLRKISA